MSRIFHRAAAIVAGMALPLSAWALVAPANIDDEYTEIAEDAAIVAEVAVASVGLPGSLEIEDRLARTDQPDLPDDTSVRPEASVTGCCLWIYFNGRWYCYPCV